MIVGITGASGFVGAAVMKRMLSNGHFVRVLSRKPSLYFPKEVEVYYGDLSNNESTLDHFVSGCDVLIHCAAEIHNTHLMHLVHVVGTKMLLDACTRYAAKDNKIHWIQLSSVGVYGSANDKSQKMIISEDSTPNPIGVYETTKFESDQLIQKCHSSNFSYTILRPSNIIGKEMTNKSFWQLCFVIKKNLYFHIGGPEAISTYIHIDDVTGVILKCIFSPAAINQIFNISSDFPMQDLVKEISLCISVNIPKLRVPLTLMRLFLFIFEGRIKMPISTARVNALVNKTRYPIDKLHKLLEYNLTKPMPFGAVDIISSNQDLMKYSKNESSL